MAALTPLQKAILVLVSMGEEPAVGVIKALNTRDIKKLTQNAAAMPQVTQEEVMEILEEFMTELSGDTSFIGSGEEWMKKVIEKAVGTSKAQHLLRGIGPQQKIFDSLFDVDPATLANLLQKEHPQTQALILSYLDPAKAAAILPALPEEHQADITLRMAKISSIHPDVLAEIEDALMEELQMMGNLGSTEAGGVQMVVDMLNIMEKKTEKQIMAVMEREDPKLADEIKSLMFVFEDLVSLDDRSMQLILREIDQAVLVVALKAANDDIKQRIFNNVSSRAAQMLQEDMESMGPTRISEVDAAQSEIVRVALRLEEEGKITLTTGSEEEFV